MSSGVKKMFLASLFEKHLYHILPFLGKSGRLNYSDSSSAMLTPHKVVKLFVSYIFM